MSYATRRLKWVVREPIASLSYWMRDGGGVAEHAEPDEQRRRPAICSAV
jgi:hypothetical protein